VEGLIGLARRAGKLTAGKLAVKKVLDRDGAELMIIATDASVRTECEFKKQAGEKNIPLIIFGSKEKLGRLVGRTYCSAVLITDADLAREIKRIWKEGGCQAKNNNNWRCFNGKETCSRNSQRTEPGKQGNH